MTARRRREAGSILLLTLGLLVVALLMVLAVVDASAVFLTRRDLAGAADSLALAAAEQADLPAVYAAGPAGALPPDPAAVAALLARATALGYPPAWRFSWRVSPSGAVHVVARASVSLPLVGRVQVLAQSRAVSVTGP